MGGRTKHDDRRAAIPVALAVPFAFACALVCNDAIAADASAAPVSTAPATSAPVLPATSTKRTSSLSWVRLPGAESCLAASELSTRVEAKLGRAVFVSPSVADLAIEARAEIEPKTRQFRVVVNGTQRDGHALGTRELRGPDCKSLEDGLVLVLALMIDRDAAASLTSPPPTPPSPPQRDERAPIIVHEIHEVREVHDAPPPRATQDDGPPLAVDMLAAFEVEVGRSPGVAPAVFVGAFIAAPRFVPLEIGFFALPKDTTTLGSHVVSFTELAGDLAACPMWKLRHGVGLGACAGVRLGGFAASGSGFPRNANDLALLADARIAPRFTVDVIDPIFLYANAGIAIPFVRQRASFTDATGASVVAYDRPAIGAEFAVGIGVHFVP